MDDEREAFNVGVVAHVRGREEPLKVIVGMYAPIDPELRDPSAALDILEESIMADWRDSSVGWLRFESHNGDIAHIHKDDIQMIRLIHPKE